MKFTKSKSFYIWRILLILQIGLVYWGSDLDWYYQAIPAIFVVALYAVAIIASYVSNTSGGNSRNT